jgi:hypothetical protein
VTEAGNAAKELVARSRRLGTWRNAVSRSSRGPRPARRIGALITGDVNTRARDAILVPLDQLDAVRAQLARAVRSIHAERG